MKKEEIAGLARTQTHLQRPFGETQSGMNSSQPRCWWKQTRHKDVEYIWMHTQLALECETISAMRMLYIFMPEYMCGHVHMCVQVCEGVYMHPCMHVYIAVFYTLVCVLCIHICVHMCMVRLFLCVCMCL